ncbi:insulinase family protein [Streptomyces sp. NPDC005180]|uniref:insulinase family protein n=1 Tax=Streptomyces sp. NPDC005180 TaxID=3156868 RepID=UPI0033A40771
MTTVSTGFRVPGGHADHRPGLAALALALATAPLSVTPAGRAAAAGGALRGVLTARSALLDLWTPTGPPPVTDVWSTMDPISDRAALSLDGLRRSAAQAELAHPLERALHAVESAVWGRSRWTQCWGGPDEVYTGREIDEVLLSWSPAHSSPGIDEHDFVLPPTALHPWADGPVLHFGTAPGPVGDPSTGRLELTLAVPLAEACATDGAVTVAAQLLAQPHSGILFDRLRVRRPLAYGIAAVPLVRGAHAALVVTVSTTPERAPDCARVMADAVQELLAAPVPHPRLREAERGIHRERTLALVRLAAAQPPTPSQRCLLEAPRGTTGHLSLLPGARPRWAVRGVPADPALLERTLEGAW